MELAKFRISFADLDVCRISRIANLRSMAVGSRAGSALRTSRGHHAHRL